jgi:DNA polymerase-4
VNGDPGPDSAFLCRDCDGNVRAADGRCGACGSPRTIDHPELRHLAIAHIDCDAFYAAVEKRDRPEIRDKPVIVGGGRRGVVSTCCYMARLYGVRSAMPMFKALKLCPQAVVIRPDMAKYAKVGREIRERMLALTPLVEPLSIDEAFLDLSGTEALHRATPAVLLVRLARQIEAELGVTVSVGLSFNKFLAKIASERDKPRGFALIGRAEALELLEPLPVSVIFGVGKRFGQTLAETGFATIGDLRRASPQSLERRFGSIGRRLAALARAEDDRPVAPDRDAKSISSEHTLDTDVSAPALVEAHLWLACETVAARLKKAGLTTDTVTVKLKTSAFQIVTARERVEPPSAFAEDLFAAARRALPRLMKGQSFRLIGIAASDLEDGEATTPDLFAARAVDPRAAEARHKIEEAMDAIRAKLGRDAIVKGRALPALGRRRHASHNPRGEDEEEP